MKHGKAEREGEGDLRETGNLRPGSADLNGIPNVVPVGAARNLDDETVLVSDQYFLKTLNNLKENPRVAISFWEMGKGEDYQIKGDATIQTKGKIYEETAGAFAKLCSEGWQPAKTNLWYNSNQRHHDQSLGAGTPHCAARWHVTKGVSGPNHGIGSKSFCNNPQEIQ